MRCERFHAINRVSAINSAINNGEPYGAGSRQDGSSDVDGECEARDKVHNGQVGCDRESKAVQGKDCPRESRGNRVEDRSPELSRTGVHSSVQESRGKIPGEKDSTAVSAKTLNRRDRRDYNAYMREYMRRARASRVAS